LRYEKRTHQRPKTQHSNSKIEQAPYFHEVDIIFQGKIYARTGGDAQWLDSDILTQSGISKVKVNKFFRSKLESSVESFCELVGLDVRYYGSFKIKNIIWN